MLETEEQYQMALERIEELMDVQAALDSPEGKELNQLVAEVEVYEDEHYPMP